MVESCGGATLQIWQAPWPYSIHGMDKRPFCISFVFLTEENEFLVWCFHTIHLAYTAFSAAGL